MEVNISQELSDALRSKDPYPINLESLVDLLKYKHISSLTTHLKRHFRKEVDYKVMRKKTNNCVYQISVNCFSRICGYVRHSARKEIVKKIITATNRMGIHLSTHTRKRYIIAKKVGATEYHQSDPDDARDKNTFSSDGDIEEGEGEESGGDEEAIKASSILYEEDKMDICIPDEAVKNRDDLDIQQSLNNIEYITTDWRQRRVRKRDFKLPDLQFFNDYLVGKVKPLVNTPAYPSVSSNFPTTPAAAPSHTNDIFSLADVERTFQVWNEQRSRIFSRVQG